MMRVDLAFDGASVRIGRPQTLFEGDYLEWTSGNYDVTSDGKQFIMVRPATANTRTLSRTPPLADGTRSARARPTLISFLPRDPQYQMPRSFEKTMTVSLDPPSTTHGAY